MLIINADDWGKTPAATDRSAECFRRGRITSTSAMVFMADSERGARLAAECGVDTGLHVNLSEEFSGPEVPAPIRAAHLRVRRFLCRNKYASILYRPGLRDDFAALFAAQLDEFRRLFGREPSHFDGHQHMHLSTNMILQQVLPAGSKVRRSFSFARGQKSWLNRTYRVWVDRRLLARHRSTDYFFSLDARRPVERLAPVVELARTAVVELMVHPEWQGDYDFLTSDAFPAAIAPVELTNYANL